MKNMFEKDHFRYLFLTLVIVAVGLLVPQIQAQAQETYSESITCVSKNQKGEIIGTQSYELMGSSPIYCLSIRTVPEPDKVGVAYYLVSRSFFSGADNIYYIWQSDSGYLNISGHNEGLHEDQALFYYSEIGNGNYDWQKDVNKCITFSFDDVFISHTTLLHLFKYFLDGDYTGADFSNWDEDLGHKHSAELGALAGLKISRLSIPVEKPDLGYPDLINPISYDFKGAFCFDFNSRTTTGYLLKGINDGWIPPTATSPGSGSPQAVVRVWARVGYYDKNNSLCLESPDIDIGSYDPSDLKIMIDRDDYVAAMNNGLTSEYNLSGTELLVKGLTRSDTIYFQIYDKSKGYGDILRVRHFLFSNEGKKDADIIDGSGNISTGSSVIIRDGTSQPGGTFDDAYDAAQNGNSWQSPGQQLVDSVESAISVTKDMLSLLGNVPSAISKLFSFLPSWCLDYLGIVFVALGVLVIYKIARG